MYSLIRNKKQKSKEIDQIGFIHQKLNKLELFLNALTWRFGSFGAAHNCWQVKNSDFKVASMFFKYQVYAVGLVRCKGIQLWQLYNLKMTIIALLKNLVNL